MLVHLLAVGPTADTCHHFHVGVSFLQSLELVEVTFKRGVIFLLLGVANCVLPHGLISVSPGVGKFAFSRGWVNESVVEHVNLVSWKRTEFVFTSVNFPVSEIHSNLKISLLLSGSKVAR
jgi:hypothetical protein